MKPAQIVDECMYVSYATQRDQAPQVSPERWAKLFQNVPAMEARYQAELAIMKAQVSAEYPLMSYVIRVVGPSGAVRYLTADNREVERSADAAHYDNAIDAQGAADAYFDVARKCWPAPPFVAVDDLEGP